MSTPKNYYEKPTQVMFTVKDDGKTPRRIGGIAYHDVVICLECGEPIPLNLIDYEDGFKELSWVSISDEAIGDEIFEENLDEEIQESDPNSQEISDHVVYVKASFWVQNPDCDIKFGAGRCYKFPSYYNDYAIDKAIQEYYIEWAINHYKDIVPESALLRFKEIYEQFGVPNQDYAWTRTTWEDYSRYN